MNMYLAAVRTLCVALLVLACAACQSKQRAEKLSDEYTISIAEQEARRELYVVPDEALGTVEQRMLNVPPAQQADFRDRVIEARIGVVNTVYNAMAKELRRSRAFADSAIDISALTINAVGALVGPAQTKAILHAISGGLIGSRDAIEKNYYESLATNVLVDRMDTLRANKLIEIRRKMRLSIGDYKIGEAINDCDEYLRAGTIHAALADLSKENGLRKQEAEDKQDELVNEKLSVVETATKEQIASQRTLLSSINNLTTPQAKTVREAVKNDSAFPNDIDDDKKALLKFYRDGIKLTPEDRLKRHDALRAAIANATK